MKRSTLTIGPARFHSPLLVADLDLAPGRRWWTACECGWTGPACATEDQARHTYRDHLDDPAQLELFTGVALGPPQGAQRERPEVQKYLWAQARSPSAKAHHDQRV